MINNIIIILFLNKIVICYLTCKTSGGRYLFNTLCNVVVSFTNVSTYWLGPSLVLSSSQIIAFNKEYIY